MSSGNPEFPPCKKPRMAELALPGLTGSGLVEWGATAWSGQGAEMRT
jgi:hypothetical protein